MKELIDRWGKTADRYELNASRSTNQYTSERLLASADTYKLCADELRRASKQPDPPEITEPDRLLIALAENLRCIHKDMDGNHKYMVTLKTQPVLRDIKAYVRRRTNGPITDHQKPCEWCKIIDENHQFFCSWCGRKIERNH